MKCVAINNIVAVVVVVGLVSYINKRISISISISCVYTSTVQRISVFRLIQRTRHSVHQPRLSTGNRRLMPQPGLETTTSRSSCPVLVLTTLLNQFSSVAEFRAHESATERTGVGREAVGKCGTMYIYWSKHALSFRWSNRFLSGSLVMHASDHVLPLQSTTRLY